MRVLLRNTQSGCYYLGPSQWTSEPDKALDLQHSARALELALEAGLENTEILLCYEDQRFNLTLPITRPHL
jgi:hypothetical protein